MVTKCYEINMTVQDFTYIIRVRFQCTECIRRSYELETLNNKGSINRQNKTFCEKIIEKERMLCSTLDFSIWITFDRKECERLHLLNKINYFMWNFKRHLSTIKDFSISWIVQEKFLKML